MESSKRCVKLISLIFIITCLTKCNLNRLNTVLIKAENEFLYCSKCFYLDGHGFLQNNSSKNLKYMLHGVVIHER